MNKNALRQIVEKIKNDAEKLHDAQLTREEFYIKSKTGLERSNWYQQYKMTTLEVKALLTAIKTEIEIFEKLEQ